MNDERIQRKDHDIRTYRINKISLSFYDDKKYTLEHRYYWLSHFHKSTG